MMIIDKAKEVQEKIIAACKRSGRDPQDVHTGYKMLENTDLKLSVFQHFFILVSY